MSLVKKVLAVPAVVVSALVVLAGAASAQGVGSAITEAQTQATGAVTDIMPFLVVVGGAFLGLAAIFLVFKIAGRSIRGGGLR